MNRMYLLSAAFLIGLVCPRTSGATAFYFSSATATVEFLGIEHDGGGVGVAIDTFVVSDLVLTDFDGDAFADAFVQSEELADRVTVSASTDGRAFDGTAASLAAISGGFEIDNTASDFDVTAFFRVSGLLLSQARLSASLGTAFAEADFGPDTLVQSETTGGSDRSRLLIAPFIDSLTVPAGEGDFFTLNVLAAGGANAVPTAEPTTLLLLALGFAAAALTRTR